MFFFLDTGSIYLVASNFSNIPILELEFFENVKNKRALRTIQKLLFFFLFCRNEEKSTVSANKIATVPDV